MKMVGILATLVVALARCGSQARADNNGARTLYSVLLHPGTVGQDGYKRGDYFVMPDTLQSSADCERVRDAKITNALEQPQGVMTFLSNCVSAQDPLVFHPYRGTKERAR